jgi:hypothetical protein
MKVRKDEIMKEECPEFDFDYYKSSLCPWCGQEIEKCKYNWVRFHTAPWDPYCYDSAGNRIGIEFRRMRQ